MSINNHASKPTPRILLGSDHHRLAIPLRNALLKAGFTVDLSSDYRHAELLWGELRHDVVLLEVSHSRSVESAIATALHMKGRDPQQFIAYLADSALESSGLTGDAILPRDAERLPQALREVMDNMLDPC
jgi:PleD family two-component response regulator